MPFLSLSQKSLRTPEDPVVQDCGEPKMDRVTFQILKPNSAISLHANKILAQLHKVKRGYQDQS